MNRPHSEESNQSPYGLPFPRDRGKGLGDGGPQVSFIDRIAAALSAIVPLGFALMRLPATSSWQGDLPLVRGLGLVGTAGSGAVTTLLVQFATLFPLGPLAFRAALVAALALGASGLVIYALAKRLLLENLATPRLAPLLAVVAALSTTLSPMLLGAATVTGGATLALLLGASTLLLHAHAPADDLRGWLARGAALGATLVESAPLGVLVLAALLVPTLGAGPRPSRTSLLASLAALLSTSLVLLLPWLLRSLAPSAAYDLGRSLASIDLVTADTLLSRTHGLAAFASDLGKIPLGVAALGLALGLSRRRLRALVLPLSTVVVADALLPFGTRALLSGDPLAPLHGLALAALAIFLSLGIQTAATMLLSLRTQAFAAAAVLVVMLDVALAAVVAENAAVSAPTASARGAGNWTDEAFERLPPRAALLVRSRAMAFRLWASRLEEGARPDVLIVPAALLSHGRIASSLLKTEPALSGLLRDLSMDGRPGEASLTNLADARPVMVELHPSWDHRLASHLVASGLWLRFAPQPLGRSDRERAFEAAHARFERVQSAAEEGEATDPATDAILAAQLRGHAASAGVMGDREAALLLLRRLEQLSPGDPFVTDLSHRLASSKGGIALEGLLR